MNNFKYWLHEKEEDKEAEDAAKVADANPDAEENPQTAENAELAIRSIYDTINRKIVKDPDPMINYVIKLIHKFNFTPEQVKTWNREGLGNLEDEMDAERQNKVDAAAAGKPEGPPGDSPNSAPKVAAPAPKEKVPSKEENDVERSERKKDEKEKDKEERQKEKDQKGVR